MELRMRKTEREKDRHICKSVDQINDRGVGVSVWYRDCMTVDRDRDGNRDRESN